MLKFTKMMRSKLDLTKTDKNDKKCSSPESPDHDGPKSAQLLKIKVTSSPERRASRNHYSSVTKSTSLSRSTDHLHHPQHSDNSNYFYQEQSHQPRRYSRSVECILSADNYCQSDYAADNYCQSDYAQQTALGYINAAYQSDRRSAPTPRRSRSRDIIAEEDRLSDNEESADMATLRRVESERRGSTPGLRIRPSSLYNSGVDERGEFGDRLSHAQSIDALNSSNESRKLTKLSLYRGEPQLNNSFPDSRGSHPQRSMSHRELRPRSSSSDHGGGIVDAFGFAATGNGFSSGGGFHSSTNLYHKPQHYDHRYRNPPEVPPPPSNYQPSIPMRNDSRAYNNRPPQANWKPVGNSNMNSSYMSGPQSNMHERDNFNHHKRPWESQRTQTNSSNPKDGSAPPMMTSKSSFGPVVRRAESMKRIMQKNRNTEHSLNPPQAPVTSEVVSEKGRSVKSIVGMFDHQPAIHEALAKAKAKNAQNSLHEEPEPVSTSNAEVQFNGPTPQKQQAGGPRSDRNSTQVIHIAKFVQIETPNKNPPIHYTDAQTSPMQLSPSEVKQPSRSFSGERLESDGPPGAIIAKAETFNRGRQPEVAIITSSSTSSYLSNDVFTPQTDIDSPVFPPTDMDRPFHRSISQPDNGRELDSVREQEGGMEREGGRQFYLGSSTDSYPDTQSTQNSNIPNMTAYNQQRHASSPQQQTFPNQAALFRGADRGADRVERLDLTDSERESNHYEDLESLRTGSIHDSENIYEPIGPLSSRETATGNYMNYPSSPSNDYVDMNHPSNLAHQNKFMEGRAGYESDKGTQAKDGSRHFSTNSVDYNESHAEQDYSNQVREASHRTLRQTSIEGKFKSPTREEQLNRYNLSKSSNVNPVQPQNRSPSSTRPQVLSQYSSEVNVSLPGSDGVKMRNKASRTDSCRVQPRTKHSGIDRTASYRELRGNTSMEGQGGGDQKAQIRENLINFYKRKSRDSLDSNGLDSNLSVMSHNSSNSGTPPHIQSPSQPNRSFQPVAMHRIQSERTFNTQNLPNHRQHQRSASTDRLSQNLPSNSAANGVNIRAANTRDGSGSYMHSWEASNVVNSRLSSSTFSDRSPTTASALTNQTDSSRARKPLVAEVSPFGMPGQKNRGDRQSRDEAPNSSAGANVLKPAKINQHHNAADQQEIAPSLPPRNYHPEEIITHSDPEHKRSNSEDVLSKPYQNVFNGAPKPATVGDNDFDSDYTEKLRRLSKQQQYVRSPSDATKPLPHQQSTSRVSQQQQSPHSHSPVNTSSSVGGTGPQQSNVSPTSHHGGYHHAYQQQKNLQLQMTNNNTTRQAILETDIDGPSSPDVRPVRPPRHQVQPPESPSSPPELPPKSFSHEINHNEHSKRPSNQHQPHVLRQDALNHGVIRPYNDRLPTTIQQENKPSPPIQRRVTHIESRPSPTVQRRHTEKPVVESREPEVETEQMDSLHQVVTTPVVMRPQPTVRKERRSESLRSPVVGEDLTITSGDPSAERIHLHRRASFGKNKRRSSSNASNHSKDEKQIDSGKPSPVSRPHQRETEFSAKEVSIPSPAERLDANAINNSIHENKPKPFDRYYPNNSATSPLPNHNANSHSRQPSAELIDIVSRNESVSSLNGSRERLDSPSSRHRSSPIPPPRSPKMSPSPSTRASLGSLSDSRKSTPSPHSSSSDLKLTSKSDPSTPVDKTFVPISTEILAELAGQGIDISKTSGFSDESKARLVKITQLNSTSPTVRRKTPSIRHIRQKSSDEILCDNQLENLNKVIKDVTITQALSQPQKGTRDYLPGLFDDVLIKDLPRKKRQSSDTSPCHSKQNSEGDGLIDKQSPINYELNTAQEKKDELVLVLKKKLCVLKEDQNFREQEIDDNDVTGAKVVELVESKCNDREVKKYKSYIDDVEKITKLLLKLSRRLARAENELRNAPMDATDDDKKSLEQKRNNLQRQHDDAKALKQSIDKRKTQVSTFLRRSLSDADYDTYDTYISIKLRLIMEVSDIEDQVSHCEEQISAVEEAVSA